MTLICAALPDHSLKCPCSGLRDLSSHSDSDGAPEAGMMLSVCFMLPSIRGSLVSILIGDILDCRGPLFQILALIPMLFGPTNGFHTNLCQEEEGEGTRLYIFVRPLVTPML
jgi:hypothetical protein